MVTALIIVAAIAWLTQLAFGGWQIRRFNRAFDSLCQQGRVGVGRSAGRFQPRAIVAIAVDDNDRISDIAADERFHHFRQSAKDPGSGRQTYCGIAA